MWGDVEDICGESVGVDAAEDEGMMRMAEVGEI